MKDLLSQLDRWRKKTFPPSKNDLEWRHDDLVARINQISVKLGVGKEVGYNPLKMTFSATPSELTRLIEEAGISIDPGALAVIEELYGETSRVIGEKGETIKLDSATRISIEQGLLLHALIDKNNVSKTLEIGFAYGFSTIWMLDALEKKVGAKHIAIDPFEKTLWHSVGVSQVNKLQARVGFEWVEDYAIHAVSDMIRKKQFVDFIYIDGGHRFDDVMVDFYLCDQVLSVGGILVLDDMWMPSIRTALNFILANRFYKREDSAVSNVAILRKLASDEMRAWDNFVQFDVVKDSRS
jgi:predicted O-methyltransferase YrrM